MESMKPMKPMPGGEKWWPDELGQPSSSGSQNSMRYEAVIRQLAAAKGQPRSQRMLADLVRWVEGDRRELKLEYLKTMIEYKTHWEEKLERRKRQGLTGPELIPHPHDIIVDLFTGEVAFKGHLTKEQKDA